jgi:2-dehydropantoate 2-reductase
MGALGSYLAYQLSKAGLETIGLRHLPSTRLEPKMQIRVSGENASVTIPIRSLTEGFTFGFDNNQAPKPGDTLILCNKLCYQAPVLEHLEKLRQAITPIYLMSAQNGLGVFEALKNWAPPETKVSRLLISAGLHLSQQDAQSTTLEILGEHRFVLSGQFSPQIARASVQAWNSKLSQTFEPERAEWEKGFLNLAINGICTLFDQPNGYLAENPATHLMAKNLIIEACLVARLRGQGFSDDAIFAQALALSQSTGLNINSTLQDLRAHRPTEVEWLHRKVANWASALGVEAPIHAMIAEWIEMRTEFSSSPSA